MGEGNRTAAEARYLASVAEYRSMIFPIDSRHTAHHYDSRSNMRHLSCGR